MNARSNLCYRKFPLAAKWRMNCGGPESLWGVQQEVPDVQGGDQPGSHRCHAQDDIRVWDSARRPAPPLILYPSQATMCLASSHIR